MSGNLEFILCSAIWYKEIDRLQHEHIGDIPDTVLIQSRPVNIEIGLVFCGRGHLQCMRTMSAVTGKRAVETEVGKYVQGFLTNTNKFVTREEAAKIVLACGQIKKLEYHQTQLFSEDLYRTNPYICKVE